jgi:hypothetical protein
MRRSTLAVVLAAVFTLPVLTAACADSPTALSASQPATLRADETPPDTTCRGGVFGSGGRC